MSSPKKKSNSAKSKSNTKLAEKNKVSEPGFLEKHSSIWGYVLAGLSFLMAMLIFNPDVSVGGDDSTYLESAYKFAEGTAFPTWQGPVYPMMLGYIIRFFGFSIVFFKFLSVLFFSASVYLTYRILLKYGNVFSALMSGALSAMAYMLLIHASTTYTEPFFMMLQAGFVWYLLEILDREPSWASLTGKDYWRKNGLHFSLLALLVYVMFQTRSLAIIIIPAVLALLLITKKFKPAMIFGGATLVFHLVNTIYRRVFWNVESVSFVKQLDSILLVNPYEPENGYADFSGFVLRLLNNSQLYLSKHFLKLCGFWSYDDRLVSWPFTIVIVAIMLGVGFYLWKNNRRLFVIWGYLAMMMVVTFVMLQTLWDQERLVMIYFPLSIGLFFYCLYKLCGKYTVAPVFIGLGMLMMVVFRTMEKGEFNMSDNFDTGSYNSYTDDWRNYMLASKWASDSLPEGSVVVCRKNSMSWIASDGAGNVKFQGINKLYTYDGDSMKTYLLDSLKATHIILANLRLHPHINDGQTITTVRNSLRVLMSNHCSCVKFVKQFGNSERAYLFRLVDAKDDIDESSLKSAITVDPSEFIPWRDLVFLYVKQHDINKAQGAINEGLRFCGDDPDKKAGFAFLQGAVSFEVRDFQKALDSFNDVLKYTPDNASAQFNKAVALYNLNRYPEALEAVRKAREMGALPNDTDPLEAVIIRSMRK